VALVDDHEVEEVGRELAEEVALLVRARDGLVEREVDLERLVDLAVRDLRHRAAERLEVVRLGLVDEDVAVGEEEDPLLHPGLPQAPDDLERGVGSCPCPSPSRGGCGLAFGHGLDHAVDRVDLVVARSLAAPSE
jgi:hypothetical protein